MSKHSQGSHHCTESEEMVDSGVLLLGLKSFSSQNLKV